MNGRRVLPRLEVRSVLWDFDSVPSTPKRKVGSRVADVNPDMTESHRFEWIFLEEMHWLSICIASCPQCWWLKATNLCPPLRSGSAGCFWLRDCPKVVVKMLARAAVPWQQDRGCGSRFHSQGCWQEALVSQTVNILPPTHKPIGCLRVLATWRLASRQSKLPQGEPSRSCRAGPSLRGHTPSFLQHPTGYSV